MPFRYALFLVSCALVSCATAGPPPVGLPPSPRVAYDGWSPPGWFPADVDLEALAQMDGDPAASFDGPPVRARSAFVFDLDSGSVLVAKNADEVRPVASLAKLVSALAFASAEPDLDGPACVDTERLPTRSGARSRFNAGDCARAGDMLGAALVASDNRAAYALSSGAGMGVDEFVDRMNVVSVELGMTDSHWTDPSGLEEESRSTARDMARAVLAVALHPVLSVAASAAHWDLEITGAVRVGGAGAVGADAVGGDAPPVRYRRLGTTDRFAGREDLVILAAKTGYTDPARYCFTTMLETPSGRRLVIALLGAEGRLTRWADVNRVLAWVESGAG